MSLLEAARRFEAALARFDPAVVSVDDARRAVEVLARVDKRIDVVLARATSRVTDDGGHRTLREVARQTGKTVGQIRSEIETANAAADIPELADALERGDVSLAQGAEIAKTEADVPGSVSELLETAKRRGLTRLREEGRRRRQAAMDEQTLQAKRMAARAFRAGEDRELGMTELRISLLPEVGRRLVARVEAQAQRRWRDGDRASTIEQRLADAFLDVVNGTATVGRGRTEVVVVAHLDALTRGFALPGEPSHIVGGPRLPIEVVKAMAREALLTVVLDDGVKVDTIARYGRHLPAALRVLLDAGEPPHYLDAACVDCGNRYRLEIDHVDPVANGGLTALANLARRCPPCHTTKTERDRHAGLLHGQAGRTGLPKQPHDASKQPRTPVGQVPASWATTGASVSTASLCTVT